MPSSNPKLQKANMVKNWSPPVTPSDKVYNITNVSSGLDESGITYVVEMSKVGTGITWGSDISFRWVYVMDINPNSEASDTGMIQKGDYIIGAGNVSLIAQDFDFVLTNLNKQPKVFNYTFFRGKKDILLGESIHDPTNTTVCVTVQENGKPARTLHCPGGTNLRKLLVSNGINVYRSITRWTNCNGKQRCGTCIVNIDQGGLNCSRRSLDEEMVLRENPESYRLSCITSVYGDVTVTVQGAVGAAQWTR